MAKDKDKAPEGDAPKKSKKKLILILLVVLAALGGGGVGGYMLFAPKSAKADPPPKPGIVVPLDAVTINLADGHYLKLKISLQLTADAGTEEIDGSHALDLAINQYSNRPMAELFSNDERNRSKATLVQKISEAYEKKVMDIYFTTFVIQ